MAWSGVEWSGEGGRRPVSQSRVAVGHGRSSMVKTHTHVWGAEKTHRACRRSTLPAASSAGASGEGASATRPSSRILTGRNCCCGCGGGGGVGVLVLSPAPEAGGAWDEEEEEEEGARISKTSTCCGCCGGGGCKGGGEDL